MPTTTGALEKDNLKIKNINDIIVNSYENILFSYKVFDLGKYFYFQDLKIGHGKYKIVYFGLNKKNKSPIIVKIDNISKFRSLQDEFKIIKLIENPKFFPKAIDCFTNNKSNYLIEYMLGPTLEKFVNLIGVNNLTKNTIYRIGIDLLYNIRLLHSFGFLHQDLKLDNIVQLWEPVIIIYIFPRI
jgi:serine/threonine protein kinase